jgi:hypothetical protein
VTQARAVAFGDLGGTAWGVAWIPAGGSPAPLALGAGRAAGTVPVELDASDPSGAWRLEGEGVSLRFKAAGTPGRGSSHDGVVDVLDQLCMVEGRLAVNGGEQPVSSLGWRTSVAGRLDLEQIESFRQVSAWFSPSDGISLVAFRPIRAAGHDSDIVAAAALEPDATPPIADPRLSTTYTSAGRPARAGLELWPEDEPTEETGEEAPPAYPRRAAGEAVGSGLDWENGGFGLHAELLHWHSRGQDGAGIYLLGKRR